MLYRVGSVSDHIHLLVSHPRTMALGIKVPATKWLKEKDLKFAGFQWQAGYGIFSVSPSHRDALEASISMQAEHRRNIGFQEEYRRLLTKYGAE